MKKRNIIILSIIVVIAIVAIICFVIGANNNNEKITEQQQEEGISKLTPIYEQLNQASSYTFNLKLNDENQMRISKKDEKAYVDTYDEGEHDSYIVKEDNTYLLVEKTKKYYKYENNSTNLTKVTLNMEELLEKEFTTGKEKIENKEYRYEEFMEVYPFIINYKKNIDESTTKTRLYFEGKDLKYIKTYVGDVEQLLKVEISYENIDDNTFEIPKDYKEG